MDRRTAPTTKLSLPLIASENDFSINLYDGLDELMEGSDYPVLRGCEINSVKLNAMTDVHEVARLLKQRSVSNTL